MRKNGRLEAKKNFWRGNLEKIWQADFLNSGKSNYADDSIHRDVKIGNGEKGVVLTPFSLKIGVFWTSKNAKNRQK